MIPGSELFRLHDTYGFSLAYAYGESKAKGMNVDLIGFALAAMKAGWSRSRCISVIREALADNGVRMPDGGPLPHWEDAE